MNDKPKAQQELNIEQIAELGFGGDLAIGHAAISEDIGYDEAVREGADAYLGESWVASTEV